MCTNSELSVRETENRLWKEADITIRKVALKIHRALNNKKYN